MKAIRESAEHHFVTTIESLKSCPEGWAVVYFRLSHVMRHDQIIENPMLIGQRLNGLKAESDQLFQRIYKNSKDSFTGTLYQFEDGDILILSPYSSESELGRLQCFYSEVLSTQNITFDNFSILQHEYYSYQKFADKKLLSAKCLAAYKSMSDSHKVGSIGVRRSRRDDPVVQVVEDDRFTSAYASNILSRDYDIVVSRDAEDAITHYIEMAPDIVFLDIHLPGLSGHQCLSAIRKVDPDAFVVMLSVDTMKENIVKAAHSGAQNFLKKPFSKERLLNVVKTSPYIQGHARRNAYSLRTQ